ncbi:hypothetical protein [Aquiflexum balticum]|uniref:hypothetical protein n=1 Tax=Aquiflexum balticum TaxID=280473 RepID=UPI0012FA0017|nr:hypothetical protein [Aquiflexum balticum]
MITKSVKSINPFESLLVRQAGVIQTIYDIVKTHGGEFRVENFDGNGCILVIELPNA